MTMVPPTIADIRAAADRLDGQAVRTPLLSSPLIDARVNARVLFKPECLQRTGSFKFRGAYNAIAALDDAARANGVVAFSSGNHAQGVAAAAAALGVAAKIIMPADAPRIKHDNTAAYGAEVITYERTTEDRAAIAREIADAESRALVPPFDDPRIIAGQGSAGLEIADDLAALALAPDSVLCCCGGGGLIAGVSTAIKDRFPEAAIWAVEPEGFDDTARSLVSGERERADITRPSICDALLAPMPGVLTFSVNRRLLAGGVSVTEAQVKEAMRVACRDLKLVLEPGGAVAFAALLSGAVEIGDGDTVVVVLSGGNVDPALYAEIIGG